ncbi:adenosylhomocysteinase [Planomonospora sp. ID91781]|uniref:Adenosylhomocysteinase n=3 Tax=Planomonospora TaxID=1998 RepID=A0A171BIW6_9ACTN|nr:MULTISPECIES: adenosylhomocysteinase [Planomonospora]MBG0820954.1 adenosylhomocysteinase [Planomonospora sp. ID91781]GAT65169.1 S-adenosyl-L-homocysteine hydrolase [Planomonospora sphaerica]GGK58441.1 adenosylhomocysteinase [Planomonospora parontospora]GII07900.1 adenosylhomocysteinase [Planomonospora parontospora subsp. parontospora]
MDRALAEAGERRIGWAARAMPVLTALGERFAAERPLEGWRIAACLHVTAETAVLMGALRAGGAEIALAASNPLSTQDDVAQALGDYGIAVHARAGADRDAYYRHIHQALDIAPDLVLDDGCDLVNILHTERTELLGGVRGGCEETTTGIIRLRQMAAEEALRFPVVAVNDTRTKRMFDNRYGTGQSTLDGIMRATNTLLAGKTVVVAGFGYCGRGVAERARGLGARVVVTEIDPVKALDASLQGYDVRPMAAAAQAGDVFVTVTGNRDVIRGEHLAVMKDGAILANAGHFDVEIDVRALDDLAQAVHRGVRASTDEYVLADGRRLLLLAEGRLVNLTAAEGHPAAVMDMSFSAQALAVAWLVREHELLAPGVYDVPEEVDAEVARLKLAAAGIEVDELTADQERYLRSWRAGS